MPKNSRPGFFTAGWEGKSYAEIQKAQNEWDLLKAQEDLAKEIKKQNTQTKTNEYKLEPREYTYTDYALLAGVDRKEVMNYMNKYNQQVNSEIPDADKINKQEEELKYAAMDKDSKRSITKSISMSFMILVCVFIIVAGIIVLTTVNIDLLPALGGTLGALIVTILIWNTITNMYITGKYGTLEQDEQKVESTSIKKVDSPTYRKFREFRRSHYNQYMEALVNEYTVSRIKYYFNPKKPGVIDIDIGGHGGHDNIPTNEIIAFGTPEDYMNYLKENFKE